MRSGCEKGTFSAVTHLDSLWQLAPRGQATTSVELGCQTRKMENAVLVVLDNIQPNLCEIEHRVGAGRKRIRA